MLQQVRSSRSRARVLVNVVQNPSMTAEARRIARELAHVEKELIREYYNELRALHRWFNQSGLNPDEPFNRKEASESQQ